MIRVTVGARSRLHSGLASTRAVLNSLDPAVGIRPLVRSGIDPIDFGHAPLSSSPLLVAKIQPAPEIVPQRREGQTAGLDRENNSLAPIGAEGNLDLSRRPRASDAGENNQGAFRNEVDLGIDSSNAKLRVPICTSTCEYELMRASCATGLGSICF